MGSGVQQSTVKRITNSHPAGQSTTFNTAASPQPRDFTSATLQSHLALVILIQCGKRHDHMQKFRPKIRSATAYTL